MTLQLRDMENREKGRQEGMTKAFGDIKAKNRCP